MTAMTSTVVMQVTARAPIISVVIPDNHGEERKSTDYKSIHLGVNSD